MKVTSIEAGDASKAKVHGVNRGISVFDLVLRIAALVGALGSVVAMGTADQALSFSTQTVNFEAQYDDIDAFKFFVIVNAITCGYLALSIPISIFHIIRRRAGKSRVLLIFLDAIMLVFITSGASAAAAIVYLAHNGNTSTNWFSICQQYTDFCQRSAGSLIGSFGAMALLVLLIILSAIALSRR
ncbi:PREDICTED: casparian strip membrane protein 2 [Nicotiana attenuata]|uniref:CASP-like protein n=1 Tax=Nicotiana attenuata TaxID=49451 RepID=A0A314KXB3_NICAT|nr:PREDICTED: casparian strip membrane protein 2 [Nicotiana attenuata]OIT33344.1 casparian strip membrane protein 2 [Nicotiana attenuata]